MRIRTSRMRAGIATAAACFALAACAPQGSSISEVALTTLEGEAATLSDLEGDWAVVNFWASFCKPCIREMPELQKLHEQGVVVVGINALDRTDLALELIAETGVTYRILLDERGDLMAAAGITGLPATLVIDPEGTVRGTKSGEADLSGLLSLLEESGYPGVDEREG